MTSAAFVKTATHGDTAQAIGYLKDQLNELVYGQGLNGAQIRDTAFASGWTGMQLAIALNSMVQDDGVMLSTNWQLQQLADLVGVYPGDFWFVAPVYSGPPPAQGSDSLPVVTPPADEIPPIPFDPIPILTDPDPIIIETPLPDVPGDNGPRLPPIIYTSAPPPHNGGKSGAGIWIGLGLLAWLVTREK